MTILLAVLALAGQLVPRPKALDEVRVSATIVRGGEASAKSWDPMRQPAQREVVRIDKDGRKSVIRITEFE